MAWSASNLDGTFGASVSSITSSSISPVANNLLLVSVGSYKSGGTPNTPTVTGCGLTWVQIDTKLDASTNYRLTVFRALGTPNTGALTIDFGGQTQTYTNYGIDQFSGNDVSGTNGSGAIVQDVTATQASGTSPAVTLAAFSNANNATFGVVFGNGTLVITEGSGFTQLDYHTTNTAMMSEWKATNDTSVDWTFGASAIANMIAIELKPFQDNGLLNSYI